MPPQPRRLLPVLAAMFFLVVLGLAWLIWANPDRRAKPIPAGDSADAASTVSERIVITHISPGHPVDLGDDVTIHYRIEGDEFDQVVIEIRNAASVPELVYTADNLARTAGEHSATWPGCQWGAGTAHAGAYANPAKGPYTVKLIGALNAQAIDSNTMDVITLLVIDVTVTDDKPSANEIASGLYLKPDPSQQFRIGLKPPDDARIIFPRARLICGELVMEDLDNDPRNLEVKSIHLRQVMPSNLPDGIYKVAIQGVRDVAGNEMHEDPDGVDENRRVNLR